MKRTTFMIPSDLKQRAVRLARERGISLGQLVREALERILLESGPAERMADPLFLDDAVFEGETAPDLAAGHDRYLYGEEEDL